MSVAITVVVGVGTTHPSVQHLLTLIGKFFVDPDFRGVVGKHGSLADLQEEIVANLVSRAEILRSEIRVRVATCCSALSFKKSDL